MQTQSSDVFQLYPSTTFIAEAAWGLFQNKNITRVYEPSAGRGDLLLPALKVGNKFCRNKLKIDVCEIDGSLHPFLNGLKKADSDFDSEYRSADVSIVGYDCMQMESGSIYSHVIMNPPFKNGVQHVLKVWDLVWDAEIVAVLNAETIRNPFTNERKYLLKLISEYGSVQFIKDGFANNDSVRRANVDVALVYLRKKSKVSKDILGGWLNDLKKEQTNFNKMAEEYEKDLLPALPNSFIENLVLSFNIAVKAMHESVFAEAKSAHYARILGRPISDNLHRGGEVESIHSEDADTTLWIRKRIELCFLDLKNRAWNNILKSSKINDKLSSEAKLRVSNEFEVISKLEFTVSNIYGFINGILANQTQIQIDMACDVFDSFTAYHSKNTVYYKGWKSNNKHRTCGMRLKTSRVVHPKHECAHNGVYGKTLNFLSDIDRVFSMLDGKYTPEISLVSAFEKQFPDLMRGKRIKTSYFDVRYYPNAQTIHFFPTNLDVIERLNRLVGKHRAWLPPVEDCVPTGFWEQFNNAEQFDAQFRDVFYKKNEKKPYCDELDSIAYFDMDTDSGQELMAKVNDAYDVVLGKNGISSVDFQLTGKNENQLLLT